MHPRILLRPTVSRRQVDGQLYGVRLILTEPRPVFTTEELRELAQVMTDLADRLDHQAEQIDDTLLLEEEVP